MDTSDPDSFEQSVRPDDRVASLVRLDDGPGQYLYSIEWAATIDGFLQALDEHGLLVESAVGTAEE